MDLLEELKTVSQQLGKFPTHSELNALKRHDIRNELRKTKTKLSDYAELLGYKANQRPRNYWTEKTILEEIERICNFHGGWPPTRLWNENYAVVRKAAYQAGGLLYFRELLGMNHMAGSLDFKCMQCNCDFIPPIGKNWDRQRFCSDECRVNFYRLKQNERSAERVKQPKVCPICNKTFVPKTTTKQKYCKRSCFTNFRKRMDKALRRSLQAMGDEKRGRKSYELLGYSPHQLLERLQQFEGWSYLQRKEWHLDHIFPVKAFIDRGINEVRLICHLENLQPILSGENAKKGSKYDKPAFEEWLHKYSHGFDV